MSHISVYIDTNCINSMQKIDALNELEKLNDEDKIIIEKTDTLDEELQRGKGYPKGQKKSINYIESYGVFVLGQSRLNHAVLGNSQDEDALTKLLKILWGKKIRASYTSQELGDARHIATASRYGGTYFVTQEKALLDKSEMIEKEFTIKVISPDDCLSAVMRRLNELEKIGWSSD